MPIYEYQCSACQTHLEKLQKVNDPPITRCPACGKETLTKMISKAGFRLKGGGWYESDFKQSNQRNLVGNQEARASNTTTDAKASKAKDSSNTAKD